MKQSRRTSLQLMNQGAEVVGMHVEDGEYRIITGEGEDEAPADLLIERPQRDRRSRHQYLQIRKKAPQCTLPGKPLRSERSKRHGFPFKGRKLSSNSVSYINCSLCRVSIVRGCHYPYVFATNRVSQAWEKGGLIKMCVIYRPSKVNMVTSNVFSEAKGEMR